MLSQVRCVWEGLVLKLCNFYRTIWASCNCWNPSSWATWSSAMCSWSAASLLTCCSSALYLCGWSVSSWPAGSTADWLTASVAVSIVLTLCHINDNEIRFVLLLAGRKSCRWSVCCTEHDSQMWSNYQLLTKHRLVYITVSLWSSEMVAALEWWSGTECTLYTDPKSYPLYGNENAIVVLNHNFEIDFLCGWTFCERFGVLGVRESVPEKKKAFFLYLVPSTGSLIYTFNFYVFPEFKSIGQKRAGLCTCHWLDVVLPRDRFLQEEVGGGPKDGDAESPEPAGLPRKLLGRFHPVF